MLNSADKRGVRTLKGAFAGSLLLLLMAVAPLVLPPGIDEPEPIAPFLNGQLPPSTPAGLGKMAVVPVFPNVTFKSPMALVQHPLADTLIVAQQNGEIYAFAHEPDVSTKTLILNMKAHVGLIWDAGLLGFLLHPNFGQAGKIGAGSCFVFYTSRDSLGGHQPQGWEDPSCEGVWYGSHLILSRWEMEEGEFKIDPESEEILLRLRAYNASHRGGGISFGPEGYLYVTIGDQYRTNAQELSSNLEGGILRLDINKDMTKSHVPTRKMPEDAGQADELTGEGYLIPNDNPFLNAEGLTFEEYFSVGHRAPHRLTMDQLTGKMYVGEVGLHKQEELNEIVSGGNYGWPIHEGNLTYTTGYCNVNLLSLDSGLYTPPLVTFLRTESSSMIGGYVYRGTKLPYLYGKYLSGDYFQKKIFAIDLNNQTKELLSPYQPALQMSFGQDNAGEVYMLSQGPNRHIYTLASNAGGEQAPQWLSETGAFSDLETLTPVAGFISYQPHVPFWSDGALKKRWMAIPNDGIHDSAEEQISIGPDNELSFPIGAVFIKHFSYSVEREQGMEEQRLETRFLVHGVDSQYYFLSYHWLPDGSDAELSFTQKEEEIILDSAQPSQTLTWTYPGVADCGSCHTQNNGMVLGATLTQLNSLNQYDTGDELSHQLLTLDHLGILQLPSEDLATYPVNAPLTNQDSSLEFLARSYLDANCSYCHQPASGNRAVFDARLQIPLEDQFMIYGQVIDQLDIDSAYVIVPGSPERSVLYQRLQLANHDLAMPPLAKNLVDEAGTQLIHDWIAGMNPDDYEAPGEPEIELDWAEFTALPGESVVHVSWNTYGEFGVDHFRIQYSRDGDSFSDWAEVASQSSLGLGYQLFYTTPQEGLQPGLYYYRVIAVGDNGRSKLSEVFSAIVEAPEAGAWVFPNPYFGEGNLTVEIQLPQAAGTNLVMIDSKGAVVWKKTIVNEQKHHRVTLASTSLVPGLYVMIISSRDWKTVEKILVN